MKSPLTLPLWPASRFPEPASPEQVEDRSLDPLTPDRAIQNVAVPRLTVTWPNADGTPRPAALICPGGGYSNIVIDKEGHAIARWLNGLGFVAAVLKYRLPSPMAGNPEVPAPIQDGLRAVRLLRFHAAEWGIDPGRVGIIGSSAGGHLASAVATHFSSIAPPSGDPSDCVSARPDFQMLLYPVIVMDALEITHIGSRTNLLGSDPAPERLAFYSNNRQVSKQTPPAFIVHAEDDATVPIANTLHYRQALSAAGVPTELLILKTGGHGFGLGVQGGEPAGWPPIGAAWLKEWTNAR